MRVIILATAALAALTIASAPAAAQGKAEAIQRYCPDMTFNQLGTELAALVEQYEFSNDPDEAAMQAASLLCGYGDAAEAPAEQGTVQATPAVTVVPPPHFNGPRPHFNGPHPRFAPPRPKMGHGYPPHGYRLPPPPRGYPRPLPPPPRGYARPPVVPPVAMAGAHRYHERYREEHFRQERPRALPLVKTERGAPYCMAETDPERFARERPPPHPACQIGAIPGKPCAGWVCVRR